VKEITRTSIKLEDTIDITIEDIETEVKTEVEQEVKVEVKEQLSLTTSQPRLRLKAPRLLSRMQPTLKLHQVWPSNLYPGIPHHVLPSGHPLVYTIQFMRFRIREIISSHSTSLSSYQLVVSFLALGFNIGLIDEEYKNGLCRMV
jgi:hypothetical protein